MKIKGIVITFIISLFASLEFYQGIYKLAGLDNYNIWLHYAPIVLKHPGIITYIIPLFQFVITVLIIIPNYRYVAFHVIFISQFIYSLYIWYGMSTFTLVLYPYHSFWNKQSWADKLIEVVVLAWIAIIGIIIQKK